LVALNRVEVVFVGSWDFCPLMRLAAIFLLLVDMLSSSFLSALHVYRNKLAITVGRVEKLRRVYFRLERNQGRILSGAEERDLLRREWRVPAREG